MSAAEVEAVRQALATALHEQVDGDFLVGADGWSDGDLALSKSGVADVIRWASNTLAPLVALRACSGCGHAPHVTGWCTNDQRPACDCTDDTADRIAEPLPVSPEGRQA